MPLVHERIDVTIEDHIAQIKFARPEKMNALDAKMFEAIAMVGELLEADSSIRAVVVSGSGGNFCSGLDKSNFEGLLQQKGVSVDGGGKPTRLAERTHGIANLVQHVVWMWRELPVPVIAAIDGVALGGGLQICLGADIRVAAPDSRFSILEMKWGIIPDMSSSQIMRHLIRDDVIRELTYTARLFSAEEAKQWGFITHISDDPLKHALTLAENIVDKNPDAIRAAKRVIEQSYHQTPAQGLLAESVEQDKIMGTANQIEAVMAALQKRKPQFSN